VRLAVLNDIHGNLPALEAVLDRVHQAGVERIIVGGDVFPGPTPHLVLRTLAGCGIPVEYIYGNGEVAILDELAGRTPRVPELYRPHLRWNVAQLSAGECDFIARWPMTLRFAVPSIGDVLFCHATPRNENDIVTPMTPEDRLIPVFDSAHAAVVVCGHTHIVMDRTIGETRVVNPGSVGMPFGLPGADWMILGPDVEFRRTTYDSSSAAERVRASGYPGADEFAATYILQPPSKEDMLKVYEAASVRSC
jgi:predicted phosphodiesterase